MLFRSITFLDKVDGLKSFEPKVRPGAEVVFMGRQEDYARLNINANPSLRDLLSKAAKLPALPNDLGKTDAFFAIEMMVAGSMLAVTSIEDGKVDAEDMERLQILFTQLTGSPTLLTKDTIYRLLSYETVTEAGLLQESLQAVVTFIQNLMMKMPAEPMTGKVYEELRNKRQVYWS